MSRGRAGGARMARLALATVLAGPALGALAPDVAAQGSPEPDVEAAYTWFRMAFAGPCGNSFGGRIDGLGESVHVLTTPPVSEGGTPGHAILYGFPCNAGAYLVFTAWLVEDSRGVFTPLAFSLPAVEYDYEDVEQTRLRSYRVTGMTVALDIPDAAFDPATRTMRSLGLWRGLADASDRTEWRYEDGAFVLRSYEADPTFDQESGDYITIYDADAPD